VNGTVLVRGPGSRLAEGIVTYISRTAVDVALARAQHAAYADVLAACGWVIGQVPAAEDCPDSGIVRSLGLRTARIREPGTLDGGDVLQVGHTVYAGHGGGPTARASGSCARCWARWAAP
jgi:dimethylargininase